MLAKKTLQWPDYIVFAGVIIVSLAIGITQAFIGGRQKTKEEYLLGNRQLNWLPVMLSIMASFLSAILIIGVPADVYTTGGVYIFFALGMLIGATITALYFVPLLYPLKLTSAYEYLELRFKSRTARIVGTILAMMNMILYSGIVAFAPSTALEAVTGFPTAASIFLVCAVATLYTTVGGMKAVVWTDTFQIIIMAIGILSILIKGFSSRPDIIALNAEGGRINFDTMFDPDPKIRHSFWTVAIGGGITWLAQVGVHQANVQRISSIPTLKAARTAMFIAALIGFPAMCTLAALNGFVVYGHYHGAKCDPLAAKLVTNSNQLIPYYVLDVFGSIPGFTGLLVAALFSGALSTVSSNINGLSAMMWEDFLKRRLEHKMTQNRISIVLKISAFVFGAIMTGVAFLAMLLGGTTTSIALSIFGATGGPLLGMFLLGSLFPWANWIGVSVSAVLGCSLCMWLAVGARFVPPFSKPLPPAPISGCPRDAFPANMTMSFTDMTTAYATTESMLMTDVTSPPSSNPLAPFYNLSYMYYSSVGVLTVIILGLIISFLTGRTNPEDIDKRLMVPVFDWFCCCLPESMRRKLRCGVNYDEDDEDDIKKSTEAIVNGIPEKSQVNKEFPGYVPWNTKTDGIKNPAFTTRV